MVDVKTGTEKIEAAFDEFINRKDIGILLINQHVRSLAASLEIEAWLMDGVDCVDCGEDPI